MSFLFILDKIRFQHLRYMGWVNRTLKKILLSVDTDGPGGEVGRGSWGGYGEWSLGDWGILSGWGW